MRLARAKAALVTSAPHTEVGDRRYRQRAGRRTGSTSSLARSHA